MEGPLSWAFRGRVRDPALAGQGCIHLLNGGNPMKKLTASLLTILLALTALGARPASASTPIRYWQEATAGLSVSGTYDPVVGNFAGGAQDDIWWHAVGTGTDSLWTSNGDATFTKRTLSMDVPDGAVARVGDFVGDDHEDIFWYGAGSAGDVLWQSTTDGFRAIPARVSGTYNVRTIDDATGKDALIFENGTGGSIWSFTGTDGTYRSRAITPPAAGAVMLVGRFDDDPCGDVFWYDPHGGDVHTMWALDCDGRIARSVDHRFAANYEPVVGQFSPGRDAQDDILWIGFPGTRTVLWENEHAGTWTKTYQSLPTTGTLLPVSNGYGLIHIWNAGTGTHQVWFKSVLGPSFNADLSNTTIGSGYHPVVGSFVGAGADILWYRAGASAERLFWAAG